MIVRGLTIMSFWLRQMGISGAAALVVLPGRVHIMFDRRMAEGPWEAATPTPERGNCVASGRSHCDLVSCTSREVGPSPCRLLVATVVSVSALVSSTRLQTAGIYT